MWFDTNEIKYSKDEVYQMPKLIRRKTKHDDTDWQGWAWVVVILAGAIAVSGMLLIAWCDALGVSL